MRFSDGLRLACRLLWELTSLPQTPCKGVGRDEEWREERGCERNEEMERNGVNRERGCMGCTLFAFITEIMDKSLHQSSIGLVCAWLASIWAGLGWPVPRRLRVLRLRG